MNSRAAWPTALLAALLLFSLAVPIQAADNEAVGAEIAASFAAGSVDTGSDSVNARIEQVRAFYATRGYKPVWTRDTGPKAKGKALLAELKTSIVHGLQPEFYNVAGIEALMEATDPAALARLDLLLSGSFVDFAHDLRNGRIGPDDKGAHNDVEPVRFDPAELIEGAAAAGNLRQYASNYLNADKRYVRLMAKLAELIGLETGGAWPDLAADGPPIAAGARDERMADIRNILFLGGDLPLDALERGGVHDETTMVAVRRFQARHGLPETDEIDAATLAEMAVPLAGRIRQIRVNLERRRWQNRDLGGDHLYVNLADRSIKLVVDGVTVGTYALQAHDGLSGLPSFFGSVGALRLGDDGAPAALSVRSGHVREIGPAAGEARLGSGQAAELADRVAALVGGKKDDNGNIQLDRPLTLYVTYVTAWATGDGGLFFRRDRFGRDDALARLLDMPG